MGGRICCTAIGREVDPEKFSYHAVGRAVDIRTGLKLDDRGDVLLFERAGSIANEYAEDGYHAVLGWAQLIRNALGDGYDVVYGIEQNHVDHIHIERDKRDG